MTNTEIPAMYDGRGCELLIGGGYRDPRREARTLLARVDAANESALTVDTLIDERARYKAMLPRGSHRGKVLASVASLAALVSMGEIKSHTVTVTRLDLAMSVATHAVSSLTPDRKAKYRALSSICLEAIA